MKQIWKIIFSVLVILSLLVGCSQHIVINTYKIINISRIYEPETTGFGEVQGMQTIYRVFYNKDNLITEQDVYGFDSKEIANNYNGINYKIQIDNENPRIEIIEDNYSDEKINLYLTNKQLKELK